MTLVGSCRAKKPLFIRGRYCQRLRVATADVLDLGWVLIRNRPEVTYTIDQH
jgi:hypothetical protein